MTLSSEKAAETWRRDWQVHRFSIRFVIILVGLLVVPAHGYAGTLVSALDQCISSIKKTQKRKSEKLKVELDFYCPGLPKKVRKSSVAGILSYRFDSISSIAELKDLRQFLIHSRNRSSTNRYQYKYSELDQLLNGILTKKPEKQEGLWERFGQWIKQFLPTMDQDEIDRLDKFLQTISMPEWLGKTVFYISGVVILGSAFWIIFREWRYYRRIGEHQKQLLAGEGYGGVKVNRKPIPLNEITGLPIHRRLPALLNWAINHFVSRGDLPDNRSLTNYELMHLLAKKENSNSEYFSELVGESERVVYGNSLPEGDEVDRLLDAARTIEASAKETTS